MSKLLFDEQPLVINRTLAKYLGLNQAIVLQQVHYWLQINKKKKDKDNKNFKEGRYWTYNTYDDWQENDFPFWSYDTVKRTFLELEKEGIFISGKFNELKTDRTKWYSIDYEKLNEIIESKKTASLSIGAKCPDGEKQEEKPANPHGSALGQNALMEEGKMPRPLPEITTETNIVCMESASAPSTHKSINDSDREDQELMDAIYEGCQTIELPGYFDEFYQMLKKCFDGRLSAEIVSNAFVLYQTKMAISYNRLVDIKNPTGWLHDAYKDALLQYKATRYITDQKEKERILEEMNHPSQYTYSGRH